MSFKYDAVSANIFTDIGLVTADSYDMPFTSDDKFDEAGFSAQDLG